MRTYLKTYRIGTSIVLAGVILFSATAPALADQYDERIRAIRAQIEAKRATVNQLRSQTNTLANTISGINAQIDETNAQLELTQARYDKTQADIVVTTREIAEQRVLLGENLKVMYTEANVSTLEMLASSKNLGDFFDRQQYLQNIKDRIQASLGSLATKKSHLDDDNAQLTALLNQQKGLTYSLGVQKNQSASLLAQTQGQEAAYQAKIAADERAVATLRQQQAAEIASRQSSVNYSGTGGYPWAGYALDGGVDPWGFYYRECTSYAAWRRANLGRPIPAWGRMGPANAKTWVNWARSFGMPVDGNPRVGDVAVLTAGSFGHVMIVEAVLGGGRIRVSQYNADWAGHYSVADVYTSGLFFIH